MSSALVLTHRVVEDTAGAFEALFAAAREAGYELRFDAEETVKHGLSPRDGVVLDAGGVDDVELCIVLGGDGTILRALRQFAGTDVPVFAMNFGEVGFLATVEREDVEAGFRRAFRRDSP